MRHRVSVLSPERYDPLRRGVAQAGRAALAVAGAKSAHVTIVLADDRTLRRLNRRFASHDRPTDVLAFPGDDRSPYIGDVVISVPRARRQAQAVGHPAREELALLAIHGVLHLLGFDHGRGLARRRMGSLHGKALRRLGISPSLDPLSS